MLRVEQGEPVRHASAAPHPVKLRHHTQHNTFLFFPCLSIGPEESEGRRRRSGWAPNNKLLLLLQWARHLLIVVVELIRVITYLLLLSSVLGPSCAGGGDCVHPNFERLVPPDAPTPAILWVGGRRSGSLHLYACCICCWGSLMNRTGLTMFVCFVIIGSIMAITVVVVVVSQANRMIAAALLLDEEVVYHDVSSAATLIGAMCLKKASPHGHRL